MSTAPPTERLDAILARHANVTATLNGAPDAETFVALSRELADLDPVVEAIRRYRAAGADLAGLAALLDDPSTDADMRALYERLLERGLSKMAAVAAAMRKLLMLAYGVLRSRVPFDAEHASTPRCSQEAASCPTA